MSSCQQTSGMTILQHGEMVADRFKDLVGDRSMEWRLPSWFNLGLLNLCPPPEVLAEYHLFHDCGKPLCRTVDSGGRQHFPNHAQISAATWLSHGGDPLIGRLIEHDMDMHTMKPNDAAEYRHLDLAPTLMLTALAELHANASMFGGLESTSFKIKFKALQRLGNALLPLLKEQS